MHQPVAAPIRTDRRRRLGVNGLGRRHSLRNGFGPSWIDRVRRAHGRVSIFPPGLSAGSRLQVRPRAAPTTVPGAGAPAGQFHGAAPGRPWPGKAEGLPPALRAGPANGRGAQVSRGESVSRDVARPRQGSALASVPRYERDAGALPEQGQPAIPVAEPPSQGKAASPNGIEAGGRHGVESEIPRIGPDGRAAAPLLGGKRQKPRPPNQRSRRTSSKEAR